jgi:hypothetical protein
MDNRPTEADLKSDNNVTFKRVSEATGCNAETVSEIWADLGMDLLDDPNELGDIREAVSIYGSAAKHTRQVYNLLSGLPRTELERLNVARDKIVTGSLDGLQELSQELEELYEQRNSVVERNKSTGGKDPRADAIAELVARIFIKTGKKITFGQMDDEPTTDFCRAVKEVLIICDNKRHSPEELAPHTKWRSPAQKAFKRHRSNAN